MGDVTAVYSQRAKPSGLGRLTGGPEGFPASANVLQRSFCGCRWDVSVVRSVRTSLPALYAQQLLPSLSVGRLAGVHFGEPTSVV